MIQLENIHRYFQVGEQSVHALNTINSGNRIVKGPRSK